MKLINDVPKQPKKSKGVSGFAGCINLLHQNLVRKFAVGSVLQFWSFALALICFGRPFNNVDFANPKLMVSIHHYLQSNYLIVTPLPDGPEGPVGRLGIAVKASPPTSPALSNLRSVET